MVLDNILNPRILREKPYYSAFMSFIFVILGFFTASFIFASQMSIVMVALSSLFLLPYVVKIFEFDELNINIDETSQEDLEAWVHKCLRDGYTIEQIKFNLIQDNLDKPDSVIYDLTGVDRVFVKYMESSNLFVRHRNIINFYLFLFLGASIAFMLLYGSLNNEFVGVAFENQLDVIRPGPQGMFRGEKLFGPIVVNNLKITLICVLLSLLYGSGAIFILNYNASIAGVMYGSSIRTLLWGTSNLYPNLLLYLPHTTIEIFAYLLAAISGGILSKAASGIQPGSEEIWLKDGLILLFISIVLIFIGGFVEVQVIV